VVQGDALQLCFRLGRRGDRLDTVALLGKEVGAVGVDACVEEDEVMDRNGKLESHQVAVVAGLDLVPAAAGLVRSNGSVGGDRSSSGRRHRRNTRGLGGWQLGPGRFDAKRGTIHHVEVGTDRVDDGIPSQQLWLCDVRSRSDGCAGRLDCYRDSFARVGECRDYPKLGTRNNKHRGGRQTASRLYRHSEP